MPKCCLGSATSTNEGEEPETQQLFWTLGSPCAEGNRTCGSPGSPHGATPVLPLGQLMSGTLPWGACSLARFSLQEYGSQNLALGVWDKCSPLRLAYLQARMACAAPERHLSY